MVSDQCPTCKHYDGDTGCDAFPGGIPVEIYNGQHDHRTPFNGDRGIMFEPVGAQAVRAPK